MKRRRDTDLSRKLLQLIDIALKRANQKLIKPVKHKEAGRINQQY